ncbi:MAG: hypothetical protein H6712_32385 [Myxococcales bacterium]|nr:hypothetical protein [Myxococcales bacterium]MCB9718594.1 hypothetical protein [Myxococcales bacterium]
MLAPELLQPTVTVARELQVHPHEGSLALAPLALLLLAVSVLYAIRRRRARRAPERAGALASLALGVALGNALCELDSMLRATPPAVVCMMQTEHEHARPELGDGRRPATEEVLPAPRPASLAHPRAPDLGEPARQA